MNGCYLLPDAEFSVAINNKGLWPNLTLLPNGEIAAVTYNHPSHGFGCGNVELWISADQGKSWFFRSVVSDHSEDPTLTRMNHAVGLNAKGDIIVLVSGWSKGRRAPILPMQRCLSSDNGKTWTRRIIENDHVPFGKILVDGNDSLICALYERTSNEFLSYLYKSSDNGESWERLGTIAEKHCESTILKLKNGEYLAAGRFADLSGEFGGIGTNLFKSIDNGTKWKKTAQISLPMQIPGDLARLRDGTILLTYGTRISGIYGVMMRISKDDGTTWSLPRPLITIPERSDCGYPSSVQVEDGTIVTAYYFGPKTTPICLPHGAPWNKNYHMGIALWRIRDDLFEDHESSVIEY